MAYRLNRSNLQLRTLLLTHQHRYLFSRNLPTEKDDAVALQYCHPLSNLLKWWLFMFHKFTTMYPTPKDVMQFIRSLPGLHNNHDFQIVV
jgi:hypothetical protein